MENNNEGKSFLSGIMNFIKFTVFLFLVYLYFERWIRSAKVGNWLLFAVMSISASFSIDWWEQNMRSFLIIFLQMTSFCKKQL